MPALIVVVGVAMGLGYIGMGEDARKRFWKNGLSGLWKKSNKS